MNPIVRVWVARLMAMCKYLEDRPEKVPNIELETLRVSALNLVNDIDKIITKREQQ